MNNFLCQEMEDGPSSEESMERALQELDRAYKINKKLTGYISSDSDSETGEWEMKQIAK